MGFIKEEEFAFSILLADGEYANWKLIGQRYIQLQLRYFWQTMYAYRRRILCGCLIL